MSSGVTISEVSESEDSPPIQPGKSIINTSTNATFCPDIKHAKSLRIINETLWDGHQRISAPHSGQGMPGIYAPGMNPHSVQMERTSSNMISGIVPHI